MQNDITMRLSIARDEAIMMMHKVGYPIRSDISIQLDPTLPFMGYTTQIEGVPVIVVSQMAIDPGPLHGLLIHEMGHIYRSQTNHPSHNYTLLETILTFFMKEHKISHEYQKSAIKNIINTIQDLYADDLSFTVYEKYPEKTFPKEHFADFFISWIKFPITPARTPEERWKNAEGMIHAAFARSNLDRHHIPDTEKKVERALNLYLSEVDKKYVPRFSYFLDVLTNLPENSTDEEFTVLLNSYLTAFLTLAK